jgi:hypothetical protein
MAVLYLSDVSPRVVRVLYRILMSIENRKQRTIIKKRKECPYFRGNAGFCGSGGFKKGRAPFRYGHHQILLFVSCNSELDNLISRGCFFLNSFKMLKEGHFFRPPFFRISCKPSITRSNSLSLALYKRCCNQVPHNLYTYFSP